MEKKELSSEFIQEIITATNIQTASNENANKSTQISNPIVENTQTEDSKKGITVQESVTSTIPVSFIWFLLLTVQFKLACVNSDSKSIYEQSIFV